MSAGSRRSPTACWTSALPLGPSGRIVHSSSRRARVAPPGASAWRWGSPARCRVTEGGAEHPLDGLHAVLPVGVEADRRLRRVDADQVDDALEQLEERLGLADP